MSRQVTGSLNSLNANVRIVTDDPSLPEVGSVGVQIGGAFTGTITFQATFDNLNWFTVKALPITATGGAPVSSTAAGGQFAIGCFGFASVQAIMTAYTAGNPTVTLNAGVASVPGSNLVGVTINPSNNGGPPLSSGLPSLVQSEGQKNYEGSDSWQDIISANPGDVFITFQDNPWIKGLTVGAHVYISGDKNGPAVEEVVVGTNNTPATGTGAFTIQLVNPVVVGGNYASFDSFSAGGPNLPGISSGPGDAVPGIMTVGVGGSLQYLYATDSPDQKRPIRPQIQAKGNPGVAAVQMVPDITGSNDLTLIRQILEQMLYEQRVTNLLVAQLKDGGAMELPAYIYNPNAG